MFYWRVKSLCKHSGTSWVAQKTNTPPKMYSGYQVPGHCSFLGRNFVSFLPLSLLSPPSIERHHPIAHRLSTRQHHNGAVAAWPGSQHWGSHQGKSCPPDGQCGGEWKREKLVKKRHSLSLHRDVGQGDQEDQRRKEQVRLLVCASWGYLQGQKQQILCCNSTTLLSLGWWRPWIL